MQVRHERRPLAMEVLANAHWMREVACFIDGLPGLLIAFHGRRHGGHQDQCTGSGEKDLQAAKIKRSSLVFDAIEAGDLKVLEMLHRLASQPAYAHDFNFRGAMRYAASQGTLVSLTWLHRKAQQERSKFSRGTAKTMIQMMIQPDDDLLLLDAAVAGHHGDIAIADWLKYHCPDHCGVVTTQSLEQAASRGHLDMVIWLHVSRRYEEAFTAQVMDAAATCGQLPVVSFLYSNRQEGCTSEAAIGAARQGHLDVVRYLYAKYPTMVTSTPAILDSGAKWMAIVQFLHEQCQARCSVAAIDTAASCGELEIVKYLLCHRDEGFSGHAFAAAAQAGHFEVVRLLLDQADGAQHALARPTQVPAPSLAQDLLAACVAAAKHGHVKIVESLLDHGVFCQGRSAAPAIRAAATAGHKDIVELLVEKAPWRSLLDAMTQASRYGYTEIVEILKEATRKRQQTEKGAIQDLSVP